MKVNTVTNMGFGVRWEREEDWDMRENYYAVCYALLCLYSKVGGKEEKEETIFLTDVWRCQFRVLTSEVCVKVRHICIILNVWPERRFHLQSVEGCVCVCMCEV